MMSSTPNHGQVFVIRADTSRVGIDVTLMQDDRHLIRTEAFPTLYMRLLTWILIATDFKVWLDTGPRHEREGPRRSLMRSYKSGPGDMELSLEDKAGLKKVGLLGIGPGSDDVVGSRRKFARRFTEEIEKLAGNMKGDCREKDRRTYRKIARGCQIIRKLGLI
ncbi:hypothetical protein BHM03_00015826 [Ensete ventricosum]|nr:hypothetical protein BHM03_00015826 [Ensete ventricosum]